MQCSDSLGWRHWVLHWTHVMNHVGCSGVQVECKASAAAQAEFVLVFTWLTARLLVRVQKLQLLHR